MASTRYGRIYHDTFHSINVKFVSGDSRQAFEEEFNAYHDSHDHDGKTPWFIDIAASDTKGYGGGAVPTEREALSIDGYTADQIEEYHEENWLHSSAWYNVPTCCVAPIISIDREFVDAGTLERHELSVIFGDMPDDDYKTLLESVQKDSFIDNTLKLLDGKILDGWHRYRVGQELNLLRKLKFQQWDEKDEGDPAAFVLARNIERRHFTPQQRAQVVVSFNERFGKGNIKAQRENSGTPNGEPKTRKELAQEASVGTSTIDRAVAVEKSGQSEAVISGEKTASEVLLEENRNKAQDACIEMWKAFEKSPLSDYLDKDDFMEVAGKQYQCPKVFPDPMNMKRPEIWVCWFNAMKLSLEKTSEWVQRWLDEFSEEKESESEQPDSEPDDLKTLQEQVKAEMPLWKQRDKANCQYESDHIGSASFSILVSALRNSINHITDADGELLEGAATAEELKELLRLMKSDTFSLILSVRRMLMESSETDKDVGEVENPASEVDSADPETTEQEDLQLQGAVNNAETRLSWMWDSFENSEIAKHLSREEFAPVAAQQFGWYIENDYSSGENYLLEKDFALLKNLGSVGQVNKWRKRFDTIRDNLLGIGNETWITALIPEADEADEDISLADLNLPAFNSFLESLLHHVGQVEHPTDRDDMSIAVHDVFIEKFENVSDREQLSILIDCAHSLVSESM